MSRSVTSTAHDLLGERGRGQPLLKRTASLAEPWASFVLSDVEKDLGFLRGFKVTVVGGSPTDSSGLCGTRHACGARTYIQAKHSHT